MLLFVQQGRKNINKILKTSYITYTHNVGSRHNKTATGHYNKIMFDKTMVEKFNCVSCTGIQS